MSATEEVKERLRKILSKIIDERTNQIAKGFDPDHDDEHIAGELARAAAAYADHAGIYQDRKGNRDFLSPRDGLWPWDESYWRPSTVRRDLIKAAALIVAELERLDRIDCK